MLTPGPIVLLNEVSDFGERAPGLGSAIGDYARAWDEMLRTMYTHVPQATGDRALIVTIGTGGRHRVWIVAPFGTLQPEEELFITERQRDLSAPNGVKRPVMFAITFRVGQSQHTLPAQTDPPPVVLPEELVRLQQERTGTSGGTIDELLTFIWSDQSVPS